MEKIYNIYKSLILESVSRNNIIDSINEPYRIKIYYQGEGENAPNWRFIDPYVFGVSTAGNEIVRAYQSFGFTKTEGGVWKTFRTDRILRWEKTKQHVGLRPIDNYDNRIPPYRLDGQDNKMTKVYAYKKFNQEKNTETNYNKI